jgi:hypothetical protein
MVLGLGLKDRQVVVGGLHEGIGPDWSRADASLPEVVQRGIWFHLAASRLGPNVTI